MVCDICGSQSIKKVGDVFVCQECGTEYGIEEAKQLLKEVDNNIETDDVRTEIEKVIPNEKDKIELLKKLYIWYDFMESVLSFEEFGPVNNAIYYYNKQNNASYMNDLMCAKAEAVDSFNVTFTFDINDFIYEFDMSLFGTVIKNNHSNSYFYATNLVLAEVKSRKNMPSIPEQSMREFVNIVNGKSFMIAKPGLKLSNNNYSRDFVPEKYINYSFNASVENKVKDIARLYAKYLREGKPSYSVYYVSSSYRTFFGNEPRFVYKEVPLSSDIFDKIGEFFDVWRDNFVKEITPTLEKTKTVCETRRKQLKQLLEKLPTLEEMFPLPHRYRNPRSVVGIMLTIFEGKADSWKEAVILWDTESYRREVLNTLKSIANSLNKINYEINKSANLISESIKQLGIEISSLKNAIENRNKEILELKAELKIEY